MTTRFACQAAAFALLLTPALAQAPLPTPPPLAKVRPPAPRSAPAPPPVPIAPGAVIGPAAPVPPAPAPEPPRPPAVIEPAARDLLTQMVAAHKSLHAFALTLDTQDAANGVAIAASVLRTRIAFQSPTKASVILTRSGKTIGQFVSNGTYFFGVNTAQKKYAKNALPPPAAAQIVAGQVGRVGLLPQTLVDPDGLASLLTAPSLTTIMTSPAPATVSGVAVNTVVASLTDPAGKAATFTFAIGQADHIIRRVVIQQTQDSPTGGPGRAMTHTETVSALKVNPVLPASTFVYAPPAGYTKLAK